ncbi:MAG: alpha/beta fold hydrolase, partial [Planctomycetes bacterium]|nr:alpha/beta fold hydrolase [Planctomycetota bacterium]
GASTRPRVGARETIPDIAIVWADGRSDAPGLYFRRYDGDGMPLTEAVRFSASGSAPVVAVGADGNARVAWLSGGMVYFAILGASGDVVAGPRSVEGTSYAPSIAIGPDDEAHLAYEHRRLAVYELVFTKFDAGGNGPLCRTELDDGAILGASQRKYCDITCDPAGFSTVFSIEPYGLMMTSYRATVRTVLSTDCTRPGGGSDICEVLDPDALSPTAAVWPESPDVLHLFWQEAFAGRDRILTDTCEPFDGSPGNARAPRTACASDGTATVVWHDDRDGDTEIYWAQTRANGERIQPGDVRLTVDPHSSMYPDVAVGAGGPVVVWQDDQNGDYEIYMTRLPAHDCNGNGIDDEAEIASGACADCNRNLIPDECDISEGRSQDLDEDGVPDECADAFRIDIVDPNPDLLDGQCGPIDPLGACLTADPVKLAAGGRLVEGIAADGVTPVLIRVTVPGPDPVEIEVADEAGRRDSARVGELQTLEGVRGNPLIVQAQRFGDRSLGLALLTAPMDFTSESEDGDLASRDLAVRAASGGESLAVDLRLVRPAVTLLHGLWSSARGCWDLDLQRDPRFTVYSMDYRPENASALDMNLPAARAGVARALRELRSQGIAATQADVVGHSMGGLLLRMYAGGRQRIYRRTANFMRGDIHKLITLDTPHSGSPLADVLVFPDGTSTPIGWVFNLFGRCTDCGAVHDLRLWNPILSSLPAAEVPSHAIFGTGGSDVLEQGPPDLICALPHPLVQGTCGMLEILQFFTIVADTIWEGMEHDFIVPRFSQEGGLQPDQTSGIGWVPGVSRGFHVGIGQEDEANRIILGLLSASVTEPAFAADGFPAGPGGAVAPAPPAPAIPPRRKGAGTLTITSPSPGAVVTAGTTVTLRASAAGGFEPEAVLFLSPHEAKTVDAVPFEVTMAIPSEAIGAFRLGAIGRDAEDAYVTADPLEIVVETDASLTGIRAEPELLVLYAFMPRDHVTILGTFDDDVLRDITSPSLGTTYDVEDPRVAVVADGGEVIARRAGRTRVVVRNQGHASSFEVIVEGTKGDVDSDGLVDLRDFEALTLCVSGPREAAGFEMPPVSCRDVFDFDLDLDIDAADVRAFLQDYTGPLIDCDGDGEMDLLQILDGAAADCNANSVPDGCDIAAGVSRDEDLDGIPDECGDAAFLRGDANADALMNISDPVFNLNYQFGSGPAPTCLKTADVNDDGLLNLADPIFQLNYLFVSGPTPPEPLAACGADPTADALSCERYVPCQR